MIFSGDDFSLLTGCASSLLDVRNLGKWFDEDRMRAIRDKEF